MVQRFTERLAATGRIWQIFIEDNTAPPGTGLTGVVFGDLTGYYGLDTAASLTAITLASMTAGTFTSSGFVEIDATNAPGWYQFCPPNAALASGSSVAIHLKGTGGTAANMLPCPILCQLNVAPATVAQTADVGQTIAELAQAQPTATPTIFNAVMLLYMAFRNEFTITASSRTVKNDAGTVIAKAALSDDGTTYTEAKIVSGP